MIASPTGSRGMSRGAGAAAGRLGLHQGQGADPRHDRRRPTGGLDVAKLVLGGDLARADQLDPVPRNPVRRLGPQSLDPETLVQAGGPVDRPRRTQIRKQVGPPRLGRDSGLIEPVQQLADLGLLQRLGPCSRRAGQPLHRVGRVHPGHPAHQLAQLRGLVDRVEDHQAVPGRRLGHDGAGSAVRSFANSIGTPSTTAPPAVFLPLTLPPPGAFGFRNNSPTWTEKPGKTSPPSSRADAVSRVKRSGRRVDVDDPRLRPHKPDQTNPLLEVLMELLVHLLGGVAPADDLHGQVRERARGTGSSGISPPGNVPTRQTTRRESAPGRYRAASCRPHRRPVPGPRGSTK